MGPGDVFKLLSVLTHKPSVAAVKAVTVDQNTTSGSLIDITELSGFHVKANRRYVFIGWLISDVNDGDFSEFGLNAPGTPNAVHLNVVEFEGPGSDGATFRVSEATANNTAAPTGVSVFFTRHFIVGYLDSGAAGPANFRFRAQTGGVGLDVTVQAGSWIALFEVAE